MRKAQDQLKKASQENAELQAQVSAMARVQARAIQSPFVCCQSRGQRDQGAKVEG